MSIWLVEKNEVMIFFYFWATINSHHQELNSGMTRSSACQMVSP